MATAKTAIRSLPKLELHVHLEGTLGLDRLRALADQRGTRPPVDLKQPLQFSGLSEFLDFLDWSCGLITTAEEAADAAHDFALRAAADGTVYAEVIVNPTHWPSVSVPDLLGGIDEGFARAAAEGLTDCRILVSILRTQTADQAEALVRWLASEAPARVVGLSVDGNEATAGRTGPVFAKAFSMAGEAGFGRTAHAGESSGAEGVVDALELLGVSRIDHGVRAVESPQLLARLAEQAITLNVCPTSNMSLYPDLRNHPLPSLTGASVPITINTDDPALLNTDLVSEYAIAADLCHWGLDELTATVNNAIDAAFCDADDKADLRALLASPSP